MNVELTEDEAHDLIQAIHYTQDTWSEAADDMAHQLSAEEREAGRDFDKYVSRLDELRRKLGDEWEPSKEFKAPDSLEGLQ